MLTPSSSEPFQIDLEAATRRIAEALRRQVGEVLKRRGLVVAMSGGVDSSVCAALAVRALGKHRVLGLFMPERDSDPASLELARSLAEFLEIEHVTEDIAPALEAVGCYARRDEAIRSVVPEFGPGWRCKLVLPGDRLQSGRLNTFSLAVSPPAGDVEVVRLPPAEYRQIVAATNFKQRTRKMLEYYHADRLHYGVVGTPNRLEYDQGFFVKGGDGLADVKPIAHLYKSQVYALAELLGVPREITARPATTDTYSLPQTQEEFYFSLPVRSMDRLLHAHNRGLTPATAGEELGLAAEQVERIYEDLEQKRSTTRYLHLKPLLVEPVEEVGGDAEPAAPARCAG